MTQLSGRTVGHYLASREAENLSAKCGRPATESLCLCCFTLGISFCHPVEKIRALGRTLMKCMLIAREISDTLRRRKKDINTSVYLASQNLQAEMKKVHSWLQLLLSTGPLHKNPHQTPYLQSPLMYLAPQRTHYH